MEYQARKIEAIKDGAPGSGCGPFFPPPTPPIPVPHTLQKVVVSSGTGPDLDLPLVLGLPLQLKLAASGVVLNQGSKKEILALPALDLASLLKLWVWPQGRLFLGALPGKTGTFVLLSTLLEIGREREQDVQVCVPSGRKPLEMEKKGHKKRRDKGQQEEVL